MSAPNMMSPEQILARAGKDTEAATVLLLAHIAWSMERIANAVECAEVDYVE